jgi:hypothetical protein
MSTLKERQVETDWEKLANKITVITLGLEQNMKAMNKKLDGLIANSQANDNRENYHQ